MTVSVLSRTISSDCPENPWSEEKASGRRRFLHRSSSTPCLSPIGDDHKKSGDPSGLIEILCSNNSAENEIKLLVKDAVKAIKRGTDPIPVHRGLGRAYFFWNKSGANIAIVKPTDEEPFAPNNLKRLIGKDLVQPGLKRSCELARRGSKSIKAPSTETNAASKIASFQKYIPHDFDANDHGTSSFPVTIVHKIGILDVRIFNTDRSEFARVFDPKTGNKLHGCVPETVADHTRQPNAMEPGMEPQVQETIATSRTEFLASLSSKVIIAKELVTRCSGGDQVTLDNELQATIKQLEAVIRSMAVDLSNIPFYNFGNQRNADIAMNQFSQLLQINTNHPRLNGEGESPVSASHRENIYEGFVKAMYDGTHRNDAAEASSNILSQLAETLQPAYQGFFCPLTKKIMIDPVTIETGITYEREAIVEWWLDRSSENVICPTTRIEIKSTGFSNNLALKNTIKEWKERSEATRISIASSALSLATSETMVLDALKELQLLSQHKRHNMEHMHNVGITQQVEQLLRHDSVTVRCEAMHLLCSLVEDEDRKVIIAKTRALTRTIKMMSSYNSSERHAAVSFLLELSKSEMFLDKIGRTPGGILILITMKFNKEADPFAAEKAEETLKNLEKLPLNIRCMAENGFLEPLLHHLSDDSEEVQMDMVSYLGEISPEDYMKTYVAERTSNTLIQMISRGNAIIRREAFKALVQISSHPPNSKILIDAGIIPIMIDEIFLRRINSEPPDSQEEAAAILANILESDAIDFSNINVNKNGHTITSHYSVYNIVHLLKCSMAEEVNVNLIRIVLSLTKLSKPLATVVSVVKELDLTQTIIEFLNSRLEELATVAAKLLIVLSSHIGYTIATGLCKTQGQPEGLIKNYDIRRISEKQAVSANLISNLPHQSTPLNLALLHQGVAPLVLGRIQTIQRGEIRVSNTRQAEYYLEGLVGILVRFTSSLLDPEILEMAMSRNLTSVFLDLLVRPCGSSEVQRLAAVGLGNLSSQSLKLSRPPSEAKKPSRAVNIFSKSISVLNREGSRMVLTCPAHRGVCSSTTTFCLLESRAAERLLACLDNENAKVVKAVLSAIGTLLDESVEVEGSVRALSELGAVKNVLGVLKVHREEDVLQRSLWLVERFLEKGNESFCKEIYSDKVLPTVLVSSFHRGDGNTKKMAENILRHLHRIMNFSSKSFVM
ncbi:hypothetical protein ZIOFF_040448 [Zingiber officinale]|uniref:RING-type E3 ubiquitin transferase n=1 Tax=Zingiber officinale TaxID=94328 RepID=A0A8J5G369_ZINOF|nr:hypothetical protein ZIOFF_040448 [Zingiber officinale]